MNVRDKVILITGGAGGLGSAIARLLSEKGARIYLLDLDEQKGIEIACELVKNGGTAFFCKIDLTKEDEWKAAVDDITASEGRIDVLVNNAGINIRKTIEEMTIDEWQKMMLVNTGSIFLGCKYVIPVMRRQGGGAIINTSSVCGLIGHKYTPEAYTASKGAVTLLTKAVASRYAKDGIRCNSIHPSTILTPYAETFLKDPEKRKERIDEVPLGRLATVDDVSYSVLYLASDEASFINGASLPVDGGTTCY
jgi:NAD(P)-dependent dehydrogenase (short-subunit alcohol dehydrogenase family)